MVIIMKISPGLFKQTPDFSQQTPLMVDTLIYKLFIYKLVYCLEAGTFERNRVKKDKTTPVNANTILNIHSVISHETNDQKTYNK